MNGYFDENFWPCYYEDMDYGQRMILNNVTVKYFNELDITHSHGTSIAIHDNSRLLSHYEHNAERIINYYTAKWGGLPYTEQYKTPFNVPKVKPNFWNKKCDSNWIHLESK